MNKPSRVRTFWISRLVEAGKLAEASQALGSVIRLSPDAVRKGALLGSRLHRVIGGVLEKRLASLETLSPEGILDTIEILDLWLLVTNWASCPAMEGAATKINTIPGFMDRVLPGTPTCESPPLALLLRLCLCYSHPSWQVERTRTVVIGQKPSVRTGRDHATDRDTSLRLGMRRYWKHGRPC